MPARKAAAVAAAARLAAAIAGLLAFRASLRIHLWAWRRESTSRLRKRLRELPRELADRITAEYEEETRRLTTYLEGRWLNAFIRSERLLEQRQKQPRQ